MSNAASPATQNGVTPQVVVNDFQISVATMNGTGSQTSNNAIIRTLFAMGIPVNGKNIFPSNIKGLPTWFEIRVNKDGYIARKEVSEVLIAMNEATIIQDMKNLPPGGMAIFDTGLNYESTRTDIIKYPLPVEAILTEHDVPTQLRERVRNMVYVGALAYLIGMDLNETDNVLVKALKGKRKAVDMNMDIIKAAYEYAEQEWVDKPSPYRVERMEATNGKILMDGNEAAALGAAFGGVQVIAWYPITPSSSVVDYALKHMPKLRSNEDGTHNYAIVQAEDELAAIGMVLGAGWTGARAMTATSGPGISLMSEFAGMAYFAEIPSVVWNIQRVGPSTGLPTRTSQGDLLAAYTLGHGDTHHVVLMPGMLSEAFEFGWRAFDVAERVQTLVFVLSDLDLGMNLWMCNKFAYPDQPMDRGKVLDAEALDAHIREFKAWGRYRDVDGDGIPYRTIPGNPHPQSAYFTRGTGHDEYAVYSEDADTWRANLVRLQHKYGSSRQFTPKPVTHGSGKEKIGILAYGTLDAAILEARDRMSARGLETDYMRVRSLPLHDEVREFIEAHDEVYIVENNHDGQLYKITLMEYPDLAMKMKPRPFMDGMPFTAGRVVGLITGEEY